MKYRKKPVVIEAVQWTGNREKMLAFIGEKKFYHVINDNALIIPTIEGEMKANIDDYIIRGVQGEYYPCKPDIFVQTYEPVDVVLRAAKEISE